MHIVYVVQLVATTSARRELLSPATINYLTPRPRSKFGEREFSYDGPAAWNRLPETLSVIGVGVRLAVCLKGPKIKKIAFYGVT